MQNFQYRNPVKLLFGKGQIANIAAEIPSGARILMTYGGGSIKKNGVYDQVKAALAGRELAEFGGIEPNPRYETLMRAAERVRAEGIGFLLAVGGGSVLDGTKFIAAASRFEGDAWDICSKHAPLTSAAPLGCVITLPATGSEMNSTAVISREETHEKLFFANDHVYPQFSVLDPEATFSLPPRQVANGVVDAFVHTTEQYLTYPGDAPLQDRFAEAILLTLIEDGPKTLADPKDYEARASLMWCATMALNGLIGLGVPQDWATHMIGHEITAIAGLDHAQTLAIALPGVLEVERDNKREKLLQYAARVWGLKTGSEEGRITEAIARTRAFFERLGVPTTLSGYGLAPEVGAQAADRLERRGWVKLGERGTIDPGAVRRALAASV
jgi:NADP-dependent alcohol dehydrogenase